MAVSAMYAWPIATTDRFDLAGHRHVMHFELSNSTSPDMDGIIKALVTPLELVDDLSTPVQMDAAPLPREFSRETIRAEVPLPTDLEPPADLSDSLDPVRLQPKRPLRASLPAEMEIDPPQQVRRPRRTPLISSPPQQVSSPLEQVVGLDEKSPPQLSNSPPPIYPPEAVARRLQGTVLLRLQIDATGRVRGLEVVQSSGHELLDRSAIDAVRTWRGQPATRAGKPVATVELLPVRFRL